MSEEKPTLAQLAQQEDQEKLIAYLQDEYPEDIAEQLAALSDDEFAAVFAAMQKGLDDAQFTAVLWSGNDDVRQKLCAGLSDEKLIGLFGAMSNDDIVDILGDMPTNRLKTLMTMMDSDNRKIIAQLLKYPEDSAGGRMTTEFIVVRSSDTIGKTLQTIRDVNPDTEVIDIIYVQNAQRRLVGTVGIRELLAAAENTRVGDIMDPDVISVTPETDQQEVAQTVSKYDMKAIPVVNHKGVMIGIITVDDIIDVINEEYEEDISHMAGTSKEENLSTRFGRSVSMRLPWLLINLATAFLAAATVKQFEGEIAQVVALSGTMTIVSGMGGNAGTQTTSIMVRELSKHDVDLKHNWKSLIKEILLGMVDGAVCGLVTDVVVALVYQNFYLGLIILLAMICNLVIAGIAGFLIPIILNKLGMDPALASSIFLTTCTDVLGFFIYLSLAEAFMPLLK